MIGVHDYNFVKICLKRNSLWMYAQQIFCIAFYITFIEKQDKGTVNIYSSFWKILMVSEFWSLYFSCELYMILLVLWSFIKFSILVSLVTDFSTIWKYSKRCFCTWNGFKNWAVLLWKCLLACLYFYVTYSYLQCLNHTWICSYHL